MLFEWESIIMRYFGGSTWWAAVVLHFTVFPQWIQAQAVVAAVWFHLCFSCYDTSKVKSLTFLSNWWHLIWELQLLFFYVIEMYYICCLSFPVPEILCGDPPILPHTGQVWNGSSTPGSTMTYYCKTGFYHNEGNNMSVCTVNGYWTKADISCKGNVLIPDVVRWFFLLILLRNKCLFVCFSVKLCNFHLCRSGLWWASPHPSFSDAVG